MWGVARWWTRRFGRISLDDGCVGGCYFKEFNFDAFRARIRAVHAKRLISSKGETCVANEGAGVGCLGADQG